MMGTGPGPNPIVSREIKSQFAWSVLMSKRKTALAVLLAMLLLTACSPSNAEPADDLLATSVAATLAASSSPTPSPPTPSATRPAPERTLWMSYDSSGDQIWVLGDGAAYQRSLPAAVGEYYGYAAPTNRILMAAEWGGHGAGPGNVAVSDLSMLDLDTGQVTTLLEDNVVEAQWAPDGRSIAYILATSETYELHWRSADGSDRILASGVTFTWSISPTGEAVAFTRETGYEIAIDPGLYVVQVASGRELKLSDVDKSGTGSIADRPMWSADGSQVLLSHWGGPGPARMIWARSDGSQSFELGLQDDGGIRRTDVAIPALLWYPDGQHLLAIQSYETGQDPMATGPYSVVRYRLDLEQKALVERTQVGETFAIIDWAVPGYSLWVFDAGSIEEYVLN